MLGKRVRYAAVSLVGAAVLAVPASLAAGPPSTPAQAAAQPGIWRLIPVESEKVPAAWVINTETGETYLCGSGAANGRARVACIEANFSKPDQH